MATGIYQLYVHKFWPFIDAKVQKLRNLGGRGGSDPPKMKILGIIMLPLIIGLHSQYAHKFSYLQSQWFRSYKVQGGGGGDSAPPKIIFWTIWSCQYLCAYTSNVHAKFHHRSSNSLEVRNWLGEKGVHFPPIGQKVKLMVSRFKNVPKLYKIAKNGHSNGTNSRTHAFSHFLNMKFCIKNGPILTINKN